MSFFQQLEINFQSGLLRTMFLDAIFRLRLLLDREIALSLSGVCKIILYVYVYIKCLHNKQDVKGWMLYIVLIILV